MALDWSNGALAEGLLRYNAAEFFAAHEDWESVWLTAPQPEKTFLQALIQVTVALHHMQRGNQLGATRLLSAALRKLETYAPDYGNIVVTLLRDDIRACLQLLAANPSPTDLPSPRIHPPSHQLPICISHDTATTRKLHAIPSRIKPCQTSTR